MLKKFSPGNTFLTDAVRKQGLTLGLEERKITKSYKESLMKMLTGLFLSLSTLTVAHAQELRFEPEFEKRCFKEIHALKCGSPDGKNEEKFMKCVDTKIAKLSPPCQDMHKAISKHSHSHHSH